MPTYRVDLAYDGTDFRGFAKNRDVRTVQEEIESALQQITGERVDTVGAGRTDARVHARHQVVSFSIEAALDTRRLGRSITTMLGPEIVAFDAMVVDDVFSARFSATGRAYRYHVLAASVPDPLRRHTTWHVAEDLDLDAMNEAAARFLGEHDFTSFCRSVEGRSSVRRVVESRWVVEGDLAVYHVAASSFCHQMVRSLTGFCVDVGRGRIGADTVEAVLTAADRNAAPQIAPPHGLVLWQVFYD